MIRQYFSRIGERTFKREFAVVFGLTWLVTFVYTTWFASADRVDAVTPLLNGTALPVLAFIAAAAGIHYLKPKAQKDGQ